MAWSGAFPFISLRCACKSGREYDFEVRTEGVPGPEGEVWFFHAKPSTAPVREDEEYFASFKRVSSSRLQLEGVKNGLPDEYQGCGITSALIPHVAARHSAQVQSSRQRPSENETRTEAATRVWESMVKQKLASYDVTEDRFYYPRS